MIFPDSQRDRIASQKLRVMEEDRGERWNVGTSRQKRNHISRPSGRRWTMEININPPRITLTCWVMATLLILSSLCSSVDAKHQSEPFNGKFVRSEEILFDRRPAPWMNLERRQEPPTAPALMIRAEEATASANRKNFDSTATAIPSVGTRSSDTSASTTSSSSDSNSTPVNSAPVGDVPLPKPFDGGIGTNYTQQSCPAFLKTFLSNDTFTSCMPFSLLLQNSVSFFDASRNSNRLVQTLDKTCNVVFSACSSLMSSFAQDLKKDSNCGQDFRRQNPLVAQAYNGLVAYEPLYHAGCEKDSQNDYCYANAILNRTLASSSDSFVYYLPLGIPLPAPATPSCSQCQLNTMNIFNEAAANRSQPINSIYVDAARMIDLKCGPTFVNATLPDPIGGAGSSAPRSSRPVISSVVGFGVASVLLLVHLL